MPHEARGVSVDAARCSLSISVLAGTCSWRTFVKIAVVGSGYVGLVLGACLAETGNEVVCADVDRNKIDGLKKNVLPIYEPGLEEYVERNQADGRVSCTTEVPAGAAGAAG